MAEGFGDAFFGVGDGGDDGEGLECEVLEGEVGGEVAAIGGERLEVVLREEGLGELGACDGAVEFVDEGLRSGCEVFDGRGGGGEGVGIHR